MFPVVFQFIGNNAHVGRYVIDVGKFCGVCNFEICHFLELKNQTICFGDGLLWDGLPPLFLC